LDEKDLAERIFEKARSLGFDLVGVAAPVPPSTAELLDNWLDAGYAGEMAYLARRAAERKNPRALVPEARSILVLGKHYRSAEPLAQFWLDPSRGRISRYAWGGDYHDILLPRLKALVQFIDSESGKSLRAHPYVDTGPVLERPIAAAAGLGFIGKHTLLIHPRYGSWFFLAEVLLDLTLEPTLEPIRVDCGTCRRCQEICPTNAFAREYVLDARRCISYLTIELKGPIPRDLRPMMGNHIFGCDDCQEVCPWNIRFGASADAELFHPDPDRIAPKLLDLIGLNEERFVGRFRDTPLMRLRRGGLLRNVAVALGNWGDPIAVPALGAALLDREPLVRGHAAWALGRIGTRPALELLKTRLSIEEDVWVSEEIRLALEA
jgi:epoxyqueuosine reductase